MKKQQQLLRIALYGGTFDPVHVGHIAIAQSLLKLFALDKVLFIPAYVAPHKREKRVTPALHRYAMLALATQMESRLQVSTIELDAPEQPYTIDTLARLQREFDRHHAAAPQLFFVMGVDSWSEITTWREWEQLLQMMNHVVVTRPHYEWRDEHVTSLVRGKIVDVRRMSETEVKRCIDESTGAKIYITDVVSMNVSSTAVRQAASAGEAAQVAALVPPPVADYLMKYKLYEHEN